MDLNKALAEIAVRGVFEGMQSQAKVIVDALEDEPVNEAAKKSLRALILMSEDNYEAAIAFLEPWCVQEPMVDTAHAFLALAYWRSGQSEKAQHWCTRVLDDSQDAISRNLVTEIMQTGG